MIRLLAVILLATFLYIALWLSYRVSVASLGFFHIYGLSYQTATLTITIGKLDFNLKRPSRLDPSWAVITISSYEYKDSACHVSMDFCLTKLWFFPVFYRFSFGPWIDVTIEGFVTQVNESRNTPPLLQRTRNHLAASTLNGETVRIGHMSTRFFFGRDVEVPVASMSEDEREDEGMEWNKQGMLSQNNGLAQERAKMRTGKTLSGGTENGRRKTASERDDVRIRLTLEQWQMSTLNHRMYTFGEIQGELRRSWLDDHGSVVVIMKNVAWIKLPHTDRPLGRRGKLW